MTKWLMLAAVVAPSALASAQMSSSTMLAWAHGPFGGASVRVNGTVNRGHHNPRRNGFFLGEPFFYDEAPVSLAYDLPSPTAAPRPLTPPEPAQPLLIEWKGDRFVRSSEASQRDLPDYSEPGQHSAPQKSAVLLPAVLIFRDGHRQEVSDYVISQGALYARSDYSTTGSWGETIRLSQLDLQATIKQNRDNGVTFTLPAGPNEVVTRP